MTVAIGSLGLKIEKLQVSAFTIPTESPESDGTLEWNGTTLVAVELEAEGKKGIGFTYGDASCAFFIDRFLRRQVEGFSALDIEMIWSQMNQSVRNVGRPGIASMAISAVDIALWDLKAKILELPLVKLFGPVREGILLYASGGFTSYSLEKLRDQMGSWKDQGFSAVKMKVGRKPQEDDGRVRTVRRAIGNDVQLFVDANGAYQYQQALRLAELFKESQVSWFEEPVSSEDLTGLRFIRDRVPRGISIAAGEYGDTPAYFLKMLHAGSVDVLQADATRCGGLTGFLKAGNLCESFGIPFSAHTAPSIHLHACCALKQIFNLEYFFDHVRIEEKFLEGNSQPIRGILYPDLTRPGLGFELKKTDLNEYQVYP